MPKQATKPAVTRVYAIKSKPNGAVKALVRAVSKAQALDAFIGPMLDVESASQEDMQVALEAGMKVMVAGAVPAPAPFPLPANPPADPATETKVYADSSSATGTAPLPDQSPAEQGDTPDAGTNEANPTTGNAETNIEHDPEPNF